MTEEEAINKEGDLSEKRMKEFLVLEEMTRNIVNSSSIDLFKEGKSLEGELSLEEVKELFSVNLFTKRANEFFNNHVFSTENKEYKKIIDVILSLREHVFSDHFFSKEKPYNKYINKDDLEKFINNYLLNIKLNSINYLDYLDNKKLLAEPIQYYFIIKEHFENENYSNISGIHIPAQMYLQYPELKKYFKNVLEDAYKAYEVTKDWNNPNGYLSNNRYLRKAKSLAVLYLGDQVQELKDEIKNGNLKTQEEFSLFLLEKMSLDLNEKSLYAKMEGQNVKRRDVFKPRKI